MAQDPGPRPDDPGLAAAAPPGGTVRTTEVAAAVLSVFWVVAVLAYILTSPPGDDMKTLFITARTGFYSIRCTVSGVGSQ